MRRLQVDLIIFALEGGSGYRHTHTSFICKNESSPLKPIARGAKKFCGPPPVSKLGRIEILMTIILGKYMEWKHDTIYLFIRLQNYS